jgi:hypothetical protein
MMTGAEAGNAIGIIRAILTVIGAEVRMPIV